MHNCRIDPPIVSLERWLKTLELQYVKLALEVASYERFHEPGSPHEDYPQLQRLEADMERARRAIELCRKHEPETSTAKFLTA